MDKPTLNYLDQAANFAAEAEIHEKNDRLQEAFTAHNQAKQAYQQACIDLASAEQQQSLKTLAKMHERKARSLQLRLNQPQVHFTPAEVRTHLQNRKKQHSEAQTVYSRYLLVDYDQHQKALVQPDTSKADHETILKSKMEPLTRIVESWVQQGVALHGENQSNNPFRTVQIKVSQLEKFYKDFKQAYLDILSDEKAVSRKKHTQHHETLTEMQKAICWPSGKPFIIDSGLLQGLTLTRVGLDSQMQQVVPGITEQMIADFEQTLAVNESLDQTQMTSWQSNDAEVQSLNYKVKQLQLQLTEAQIELDKAKLSAKAFSDQLKESKDKNTNYKDQYKKQQEQLGLVIKSYEQEQNKTQKLSNKIVELKAKYDELKARYNTLKQSMIEQTKTSEAHETLNDHT